MLEDLLNIGSFGLKALGLGADKSADKYAREMHQENLKQQKYQFETQMNESIQRRVRDAKQSGIHPLFALGASVGASPTASAGVPGQRGGQGFRAMAEGLGLIAKNKASARRDEAEAALADAQAAKLRQEAESQGHDKEFTPPTNQRYVANQVPIVKQGQYETPIKPTQSRPGVETGVSPTWQDMTDHHGRTYQVPHKETFEEPWSPATLGAIYHHLKMLPVDAWNYFRHQLVPKLDPKGQQNMQKLQKKMAEHYRKHPVPWSPKRRRY